MRQNMLIESIKTSIPLKKIKEKYLQKEIQMCTKRGVGQIAGMVGPLTKLSLYFHNSQRNKSPFE